MRHYDNTEWIHPIKELEPVEELGSTDAERFHEILDVTLGNTPANEWFLRRCIETFGELPLSDGSYRMAMFCGPANTTYAHLLSQISGIPLRYDDAGHDPGPRLELRVGYYYPPNDPELISDHTHIRYHDGRGTISYIDSTYPLLWGEAAIGYSTANELIHFRSYPTQNFDTALANEFHLYDFTPDTPSIVLKHPFMDSPLHLKTCEQLLNSHNNAAWPEQWRDAAIKMFPGTSKLFMDLLNDTLHIGERYSSTLGRAQIKPGFLPSRLMESIYRERYRRKIEGTV